MGRFDNLLQGKGKEIKIGDEVFTIKPLPAKFIGLFMDVGENKMDATFELVAESLKTGDPTITVDDIKELPMSVLNDIIEVITEVNEIKTP